MKKLLLIIALMPIMAFSQIGNNPTIFHYGIELPNISKDVNLQKVLVVDNNGLVKWTDEISGGDVEISQESGNTIEEKNDGLYVGQAFGLEDVTQQAYQDKAIYVIPFDNKSRGQTYQEGSIDFSLISNSNKTYKMGPYSAAFGLDTEASGTFSAAFGSETVSSGDRSAAFGSNTEASGDTSTAFGINTTASGEYSFAVGANTTASGDYSFAVGGGSTASGESSIASGSNTFASGKYSFAVGYGVSSNEYSSLSIGRYTTEGSPETAWNNGSAIFKVGNGISNANRKNAYTLYNDGRSEQEKSFEITTEDEGVILKSADGTRWKITVENDGSLKTTEL